MTLKLALLAALAATALAANTNGGVTTFPYCACYEKNAGVSIYDYVQTTTSISFSLGANTENPDFNRRCTQDVNKIEINSFDYCRWTKVTATYNGMSLPFTFDHQGVSKLVPGAQVLKLYRREGLGITLASLAQQRVTFTVSVDTTPGPRRCTSIDQLLNRTATPNSPLSIAFFSSNDKCCALGQPKYYPPPSPPPPSPSPPPPSPSPPPPPSPYPPPPPSPYPPPPPSPYPPPPPSPYPPPPPSPYPPPPPSPYPPPPPSPNPPPPPSPSPPPPSPSPFPPRSPLFFPPPPSPSPPPPPSPYPPPPPSPPPPSPPPPSPPPPPGPPPPSPPPPSPPPPPPLVDFPHPSCFPGNSMYNGGKGTTPSGIVGTPYQVTGVSKGSTSISFAITTKGCDGSVSTPMKAKNSGLANCCAMSLGKIEIIINDYCRGDVKTAVVNGKTRSVSYSNMGYSTTSYPIPQKASYQILKLTDLEGASYATVELNLRGDCSTPEAMFPEGKLWYAYFSPNDVCCGTSTLAF